MIMHLVGILGLRLERADTQRLATDPLLQHKYFLFPLLQVCLQLVSDGLSFSLPTLQLEHCSLKTLAFLLELAL